jgi:hypothetical protein
MNRYALIGTYTTRNNVEVIAFSDDIKHLKRIETAINDLNHIFMDKDRDEIPDKAWHIINTQLSEIDIHDEQTDYVHEIDIAGIIELRLQDLITKSCGICGKTLYEGSEQDAKGQIIYCTECPGKA